MGQSIKAPLIVLQVTVPHALLLKKKKPNPISTHEAMWIWSELFLAIGRLQPPLYTALDLVLACRPCETNVVQDCALSVGINYQ